MKEKTQLTFSKKYLKLSRPIFTTIRWLDARYDLGRKYDIIYIVPNMFHTRQKIGKARIIKLEIVKIKDLSDDAIELDAECLRDEFMKQLEEWYKNKPDWKGVDSEVQILTCQRVS